MLENAATSVSDKKFYDACSEQRLGMLQMALSGVNQKSIADAYSITQSAVSHHFETLREGAGMPAFLVNCHDPRKRNRQFSGMEQQYREQVLQIIIHMSRLKLPLAVPNDEHDHFHHLLPLISGAHASMPHDWFMQPAHAPPLSLGRRNLITRHMVDDSSGSNVQKASGNATLLLGYFSKVAQLGNFTNAATELGVTQSAVSHAIRDLNLLVGGKLLQKKGGAYHLAEPLGNQALGKACIYFEYLGQLKVLVEEINMIFHLNDAARLSSSDSSLQDVLSNYANYAELAMDLPEDKDEGQAEADAPTQNAPATAEATRE